VVWIWQSTLQAEVPAVEYRLARRCLAVLPAFQPVWQSRAAVTEPTLAAERFLFAPVALAQPAGCFHRMLR
jgi:hypothetical protein